MKNQNHTINSRRGVTALVAGFLVICLVAFVPKTHADFIGAVDQEQTVWSCNNNGDLTVSKCQTFTPTFAGLDAVEMMLRGPVAQDAFFVHIRETNLLGRIVGTSSTTTVPDDHYYWEGVVAGFSFPSVVPLTPGNIYVIELVPVTLSNGFFSVYVSCNDVYPSGEYLSSGGVDAWFRTGLQHSHAENVAIGKMTTASGYWGEYVPSRATDGDVMTHWVTDIPGSPADPQWLKVDLSANVSVVKIVLTGPSNPSYVGYTSEYNLYTSLDETNWTTVGSGTLIDTIDPIDIWVISNKLARYVRYDVVGGSHWAGLYELEVYATVYDYTYTTNNGAITITDYTGPGGDVTIPDMINSLPVTSIGDWVFAHCTSLTSIIIPDSVTSIGPYAFYNCTSLTNAMIGNGVTSIGDAAFAFCGFTIITIPDSVTSLGSWAFADCYSLTEVYFEGNIPSVGDDVFYSDNNAIGYYLAGTTGWDTWSDDLPVELLPYNYTISEGNVTVTQYIGTNTVVVIPDTIKGLPVTSIGNGAFGWCDSLTSVTIPDGVTTIGANAFQYCTSLTSITIPGSVTSIGSYAFNGCYSLTSIAVDEGNSVYSSVNGVLFDNLKTTLILCPRGKTGNYTVPSSVTSIGDIAFDGCTSLTNVAIGTNVTRIGAQAFWYCYNLISVAIPNSVTSIEWAAFYHCTSLADVTIPNSVTNIGSWAFAYSGLTSVTIPNSVTSIGESVFENCVHLTSVTIPNSVTDIGNRAFFDCFSLAIVTIGNSVTSIGAGAFGWCYANLTSVTIPDSVTSIGEGAFVGCGSLTSVTIGNSVTNIGNGAFQNCANLTGVWFKGNAPSVGDFVFDYDDNAIGYYLAGTTGWDLWADDLPVELLPYNYTISEGNVTVTQYIGTNTVVVIPDTIEGLPVTSIGTNAFYQRSGLTSVTMGTNLLTIGDSAFRFCGLTNVTIGGSVTNIGDYAFQGCTGLFSIAIPDSVNSIGGWAFYSCTGLTSVMIGTNVTSIGYATFWGCSSLTSITIPDSVTSIGSGSFQYCTGLTSVTIGNGVTDISHDAFSFCSSLTSITIGNGVTSIGDGAFYNCTSLTNAIIGNSVTSIGANAFQYCTSLTSITIPSSVTSIGAVAFRYCFSLTSVIIPNSVTIIGDSAFQACTSLTNVIIGSGVTLIKDWAFVDCTSLPNVVIPGNVASIGNGAFAHCPSLSTITVATNNLFYSSLDGVLFNESRTTLVACPGGKPGLYTIPNSVTNIGSYAFFYCPSLTSVTIPDSVTGIGDSAFAYCFGLTSVVIPGSVTRIGDYSFYNCTSLSGVYFLGNAPSLASYVFDGTGTTVYRLSGATGWPPVPELWANRPTALWDPASDADTDGIPASWELQYFGGPTNADPNAICANGINTIRQAYIAGLNPNDPQSALRTSALSNGKVLGWSPTSSGRVYNVYWSTNLMNGFPPQPLATNVPWTQTSFTNSTVAPRGFYKIDVRME